MAVQIMVNEKSVKGKLNKTELIKIGKGLLIAVGGVVLTFVSEVVLKYDYGDYTALVVAGSSVLINAGRQFLKNE